MKYLSARENVKMEQSRQGRTGKTGEKFGIIFSQPP